MIIPCIDLVTFKGSKSIPLKYKLNKNLFHLITLSREKFTWAKSIRGQKIRFITLKRFPYWIIHLCWYPWNVVGLQIYALSFFFKKNNKYLQYNTFFFFTKQTCITHYLWCFFVCKWEKQVHWLINFSVYNNKFLTYKIW